MNLPNRHPPKQDKHAVMGCGFLRRIGFSWVGKGFTRFHSLSWFNILFLNTKKISVVVRSHDSNFFCAVFGDFCPFDVTKLSNGSSGFLSVRWILSVRFSMRQGARFYPLFSIYPMRRFRQGNVCRWFMSVRKKLFHRPLPSVYIYTKGTVIHSNQYVKVYLYVSFIL